MRPFSRSSSTSDATAWASRSTSKRSCVRSRLLKVSPSGTTTTTRVKAVIVR